MEVQPHIQLSDEINVTKAIIVGDIDRVDRIGSKLANVINLEMNREYKSIVGNYGGERLLVLSTGIGGPSAAIAIEELSEIGVKEIIRVGSCGAMTADFKVGEIMVGTGVVRDEGLTKKYIPAIFPALPSSDFLLAAMVDEVKAKFGIIRSHDGFYMEDNEQTEAYWAKNGVLGADMESSSLYVIGYLRGLKTLSILTNVVPYSESLSEGVNKLVDGDPAILAGEERAIDLALHILVGAEN